MTSLRLAVESLFSRLSSPVPLTKLLVGSHLATILTSQDTRAIAQEALIKGLREARFESEVTELLAVPLIAGDSSLDIDALRAAIEFPSVLSDSILSLISGREFLSQSLDDSSQRPLSAIPHAQESRYPS